MENRGPSSGQPAAGFSKKYVVTTIETILVEFFLFLNIIQRREEPNFSIPDPEEPFVGIWIFLEIPRIKRTSMEIPPGNSQNKKTSVGNSSCYMENRGPSSGCSAVPVWQNVLIL